MRATRLSLRSRLRPMELNDTLIYDGRRYIVVGFDPMSVRPQRVYLRDVTSGEEVTRLYEDLMSAVRDVARSNQARRERDPRE